MGDVAPMRPKDLPPKERREELSAAGRGCVVYAFMLAVPLAMWAVIILVIWRVLR